jgi:dTDP-4-dehydrorhamnose 3,5-epimerase
VPFTFRSTRIAGAVVIEPTVFQDDRGFFLESYKQSDFARAGIYLPFAQENHSRSMRGVLRGLHYQREPHGQGKLVRVVEGEVFDVAVDIRDGSPTYLQWEGVRLSAANRQCLYVPEGCAHGFCVLSQQAEVIYKTTAEYAPEYEDGIRWDDPSLRISWPIRNPTLSSRDAGWPALRVRRSATG